MNRHKKTPQGQNLEGPSSREPQKKKSILKIKESLEDVNKAAKEAFTRQGVKEISQQPTSRPSTPVNSPPSRTSSPKPRGRSRVYTSQEQPPLIPSQHAGGTPSGPSALSDPISRPMSRNKVRSDQSQVSGSLPHHGRPSRPGIDMTASARSLLSQPDAVPAQSQAQSQDPYQYGDPGDIKEAFETLQEKMKLSIQIRDSTKQIRHNNKLPGKHPGQTKDIGDRIMDLLEHGNVGAEALITYVNNHHLVIEYDRIAEARGLKRFQAVAEAGEDLEVQRNHVRIVGEIAHFRGEAGIALGGVAKRR